MIGGLVGAILALMGLSIMILNIRLSNLSKLITELSTIATQQHLQVLRLNSRVSELEFK